MIVANLLTRLDRGWIFARRVGRAVVAVHLFPLEWRIGPSVKLDSSYVHVRLDLPMVEFSVSWRRPSGVALWLDRTGRL